MTLTLTLAVADLERTAIFYGEILRLPLQLLTPLPGQPSVLLLCAGDADVLFRDIENFEARHPALFQNIDRHPLGVGVVLEFPSQALEPIIADLDRRSIHLLYELEDTEFGRREIWLHDPDGYLVVLREEGLSPKKMPRHPGLVESL
jgi:catechol 2,3-dioxygenase-like lactoylglutathione lyase family enzyme